MKIKKISEIKGGGPYEIFENFVTYILQMSKCTGQFSLGAVCFPFLVVVMVLFIILNYKISAISVVLFSSSFNNVVSTIVQRSELSDFSSRRAEFGRLAVLGWSENLPEPLDGVTV